MLVAAAIEHAIEKGVTVHDTHSSRVHANVIWNLRGAGVYVEDGNEMNNTISENVVLCGDMPKHECKIPHAQHASGVGLYVIGMRNNYLRNRAAGFETGIYTNGGSNGIGTAAGLACPIHTPFLRFEGNVMHDCRRWGLYLGNQMARNVVQARPHPHLQRSF